MRTHLNARLEHDVRISGVGQAEDAPEAIRRQVSNLEDLELRRLPFLSSSSAGESLATLVRVQKEGKAGTDDGPHVEFLDFDPVCNDRRLGPLVQRLEGVIGQPKSQAYARPEERTCASISLASS